MSDDASSGGAGPVAKCEHDDEQGEGIWKDSSSARLNPDGPHIEQCRISESVPMYATGQMEHMPADVSTPPILQPKQDPSGVGISGNWVFY
jgi:hypothetical protein